MPVKAELENYECRHGLGYTKIKSSRNKLAADLLSFIPIELNAEIQKLRRDFRQVEKQLSALSQ